MNLLQFLAVPLVTCLLIAGTPRAVYNRMFALVGTAVQLFLVIYLIRQFIAARIQQPAEVYFLQQFEWFPTWGIQFQIGVDGISLSMMLLTALVVLAGVLVSWNQEKMSREFFFLLVFLSLGAYGFFMSRDIFTLFFFLELAVLPKYEKEKGRQKSQSLKIGMEKKDTEMIPEMHDGIISLNQNYVLADKWLPIQ